MAAVPPLVAAGLGAQAVGISAQAVYHLAGGGVPWLTETRTAVLDHVLSNAGVACLAWQSALWIRRGEVRAHPGRGAVVIGTAVEVAGALADGAGHVVGREFRPALALIGAGFAVVTVGAALGAGSRPAPGG